MVRDLAEKKSREKECTCEIDGRLQKAAIETQKRFKYQRCMWQRSMSIINTSRAMVNEFVAVCLRKICQ